MNNPQLEDGFTRIANEILDALMRTKFSANQSRMIWCVIRKTYGYGKKDDWIALSQFEALTGITRPHICRALVELEMRNVIARIGKGGMTKVRFNKRYTEWASLPIGVRGNHIVARSGTVPESASTLARIGNRPLPVRAHTKENTTKETITKESVRTPKQIAKEFFDSEEKQRELVEFFCQKGGDRAEMEQELRKFVDYWTEPNKSGTRTRWEMQATFDVKRRLVRWFGKVGTGSARGRGVTVIT